VKFGTKFLASLLIWNSDFWLIQAVYALPTMPLCSRLKLSAVIVHLAILSFTFHRRAQETVSHVELRQSASQGYNKHRRARGEHARAHHYCHYRPSQVPLILDETTNMNVKSHM
jgi:hypothetical protein